jgi:hypothetical protein
MLDAFQSKQEREFLNTLFVHKISCTVQLHAYYHRFAKESRGLYLIMSYLLAYITHDVRGRDGRGQVPTSLSVMSASSSTSVL